MPTITLENCALTLTGRVFKLATVRDEPYACLPDPEGFVARQKRSHPGFDLLTFMQEVPDVKPKYQFPLAWESLAVLPISTHEHWFKKQINDKTRNMVRKSQKAGVEFRVTGLDDDFVRGVVAIYNETPVRQGKPFTHYGKDFATIRKDLSTFPGQSLFVGAYHGGEMIGFIKLVRGRDVFSLMHILSRLSHRNMAPTNGLIGKAVELCAAQQVPYLHYSNWSRRGLGDFKRHHGFVQHDVPRYYVPLNAKGQLMLRLRLYRRLTEWVPESWLDSLAPLREKWSALKVGAAKSPAGQ